MAYRKQQNKITLVRMKPELHKSLKVLAAKEGKSIKALVEICIKKHLKI